MAHKFVGDFSELALLVSEQGFVGSWKQDGGKYTFFEARHGGILNWVAESGSLWIQGSDRSPLSVFFSSPRAQAWGSKQVHSIFVVHGRDQSALPHLILFLTTLGCAPKLLALSGGGGLTIIEALEKTILSPNSVDFGIVTLTGDDYGYLKEQNDSERRLRARQNVVFEMGMLMAKLGRSRVAMLLKEEIELPSDVKGVVYIEYKNDIVQDAGQQLIRRFEGAGLRFSEKQVTAALALRPPQIDPRPLASARSNH